MKQTALTILAALLLFAGYTVAQDASTEGPQPHVYIVEAPRETYTADGEVMAPAEAVRIVSERSLSDLKAEIQALREAVDAQNPTHDLREVTDWRIIAGQLDGFGPARSKQVLAAFRVFEQEQE